MQIGIIVTSLDQLQVNMVRSGASLCHALPCFITYNAEVTYSRKKVEKISRITRGSVLQNALFTYLSCENLGGLVKVQNMTELIRGHVDLYSNSHLIKFMEYFRGYLVHIYTVIAYLSHKNE